MNNNYCLCNVRDDRCCCYLQGIPCCFQQLYNNQFVMNNNLYPYNNINHTTQPLNSTNNSQKITFLNLNNDLRRLWEEHIIWTKLTFMALANNDPGVQLITKRLLKNANDFGTLFSILYDENIANNFTNLMHDHLTIAADLVVAAKKGDNDLVKSIDQKWHKNADDIAKFLNNINPYFNEFEIKNMLYDHLELTKNSAIAILTNNYEKCINLFDQIHIQALMMADMFLNGLTQQFTSVIENNIKYR